jgi:hypothetical protein
LKDVIDQVTPGIFGSSNPWVLDRARGTKCCILDIDRGEIHLNNSEDDVEAWDGSITSFERAWVAKLVSVVRHHESDEDRNRDFVGSDAWVIGATAIYLVELLSTASRVVSGHSESWASEQRRRYGSRWIREWSSSDVYVHILCALERCQINCTLRRFTRWLAEHDGNIMSLTEPDPPAASSGLKGSIFDTLRATSAEVRVIIFTMNPVRYVIEWFLFQVESRIPEFKSASADLVCFLFHLISSFDCLFISCRCLLHPLG